MSKSSLQCLDNGLERVVAAVNQVSMATAADIADAIVAAERNVVTKSARILGTASQPLPGVAPGTRGRIVQINRAASGVARVTLDGTPAGTTAAIQINNVNNAVRDVNNVDLSLVRVSSSVSNRAVHIIWEEWP